MEHAAGLVMWEHGALLVSVLRVSVWMSGRSDMSSVQTYCIQWDMSRYVQICLDRLVKPLETACLTPPFPV